MTFGRGFALESAIRGEGRVAVGVAGRAASKATLGALQRGGIVNVLIMGGPADVSSAVEAALANPAPGATYTVLRVPGAQTSTNAR